MLLNYAIAHTIERPISYLMRNLVDNSGGNFQFSVVGAELFDQNSIGSERNQSPVLHRSRRKVRHCHQVQLGKRVGYIEQARKVFDGLRHIFEQAILKK